MVMNGCVGNILPNVIRSYKMEARAQNGAINFALVNENGKIKLEVSGLDTDDALANLVDLLRDTIESLGVDAEALSY